MAHEMWFLEVALSCKTKGVVAQAGFRLDNIDPVAAFDLAGEAVREIARGEREE
jgi:hypothetical protein